MPKHEIKLEIPKEALEVEVSSQLNQLLNLNPKRGIEETFRLRFEALKKTENNEKGLNQLLGEIKVEIGRFPE